MWLSARNCVYNCAIAALVLLVSASKVGAFGIAALAVGNGAAGDSSNPTSLPKRVTILPDSRAEVSDTSLWYHHLKEKIVKDHHQVEASIEDMPDPYSFNTKRYETFWLGFMNDELALSPETLVVGHGTAADAVLRYIENHEGVTPSHPDYSRTHTMETNVFDIDANFLGDLGSGEVWGALLVCPGGELYHAGERHGRAYIWSRMRKACPWIAIIHGTGDPLMGDAEARRVKDALRIPSALYREVKGGQERLRDRIGPLPEVEELIANALAPQVNAPKDYA